MKSPFGATHARGAGSAILAAAVLAAVMTLAAGTVHAQREGGRGDGTTWRSTTRGGERARSGGEVRQKSGGARGGDRSLRRGDRVRSGGDARWKGDGGRTRGDDRAWRGGDVRWKRDGGRVNRGDDWRARNRRDDRGRVYRNPPRYYGGPRYYYRDTYYRRPVVYRYPRTYVSVGIGLPYYCPPAWRYRVVRHPVIYDYAVEVNNLPPAGCYYWDPHCGLEFRDLDSYTDHIDREGHAGTIEIVEYDTGNYVRTLEFVGGYWVVQR